MLDISGTKYVRYIDSLTRRSTHFDNRLRTEDKGVRRGWCMRAWLGEACDVKAKTKGLSVAI